MPLLERLKFFSIFASNIDEFFMVRVSGLKEMLDIKDLQPMPGELSPTEQLKVMARDANIPIVGVSETMPVGAQTFQGWQAGQLRLLLNALQKGSTQ